MPITNEDSEHLRLLSIFHYVLGGLAGLFSLLPVIHLVMGLAMVRGELVFGNGKGPPPLLGWFFIVFASVAIVCGLSLAVCLLYSARFLRERRHYLFCLVVAGVESMIAPFGTVLGVFTILVLVRPSVKAAFNAGQAVTEAPAQVVMNR